MGSAMECVCIVVVVVVGRRPEPQGFKLEGAVVYMVARRRSAAESKRTHGKGSGGKILKRSGKEWGGWEKTEAGQFLSGLSIMANLRPMP